MGKMIIGVRVHYNPRGTVAREPFIVNPSVLRDKFKWKPSDLDAFAAAAATGAEQIEFLVGQETLKFRKSYDRATPLLFRPDERAFRDIQYTRVVSFENEPATPYELSNADS